MTANSIRSRNSEPNRRQAYTQTTGSQGNRENTDVNRKSTSLLPIDSLIWFPGSCQDSHAHKTAQQRFSLTQTPRPLSALLVGRPADSCSERVIGELVRFNYAHVVICEAPFCTSAQAQWDLTAPSLPIENYVVHPFSGLAPSGPDFLFRRLITHTASPTLIWISSANDHTSTEAASGSSWWVRVGQWLSLKISSVRPCLSPAFIVEPFKNDTKDQRIISKKVSSNFIPISRRLQDKHKTGHNESNIY